MKRAFICCGSLSVNCFLLTVCFCVSVVREIAAVLLCRMITHMPHMYSTTDCQRQQVTTGDDDSVLK